MRGACTTWDAVTASGLVGDTNFKGACVGFGASRNGLYDFFTGRSSCGCSCGCGCGCVCVCVSVSVGFEAGITRTGELM